MLQTRIIKSPEGVPVSVEVPYSEWERIQRDLRTFKQLRRISRDLRSAFAEVEAHKRGEKELLPLSEFLAQMK